MKKLIVVLLGVLVLLPYSVFAADFNKDLKYGLKGIEVKQMQEFLRDQGIYKGPITSNFLSMSLAAVKEYQKNNGLKMTGLWNLETRKLANNLENEVVMSSDKPSWYDEWVRNYSTSYVPSVVQPVQVASSQPVVYQNSVVWNDTTNAPNTVSSGGIQNEQNNNTLNSSNLTKDISSILYNLVSVYPYNNSIQVQVYSFGTTYLTNGETIVTVTIDGRSNSQVIKDGKAEITISNLEPVKEYNVKVILTGQEYGTFEKSVTTKSGILCTTKGLVNCANANIQDIVVKAIQCRVIKDFSSNLTINWKNGTIYEKEFPNGTELEVQFPYLISLPNHNQPVNLFTAFNGINDAPCWVSKFELNGREFKL